jgi:hypothetical protein
MSRSKQQLEEQEEAKRSFVCVVREYEKSMNGV